MVHVCHQIHNGARSLMQDAQKHGLWRVAEDDPDSDLYAESSDADAVMGYITPHARESA